MRSKLFHVALCVLIAGSAGCVRVNHETRVEKGLVLRAYEREVPSGEGGVIAEVSVAYPEVTLSFARFERCRQERVEEVVEERITESFAPSAGPSFALGVTGTAAGAGLLAFRGAFSDQPNTRQIDENGNYGPSARTVSTTWSAVLLTVGLPALVTGVVGLLQSGEKVERRKVEQVASSKEHACNQAPVDGEVQLVRVAGEGGDTQSVPTRGGRVTFGAGQLTQMRLASVHVNGEQVLMPEEEAAKLEAFLSCQGVLPVPAPAGLAVMAEAELVDRYNAARTCALVAGAQGEKASAALGAEILRRREGKPGPEVREGPRLRSFEEALSMYPPKFELREGSAGLEVLAAPETAVGAPVMIQGVLVRHVEENILVVQIGSSEVLLFLPPDAPFAVSVGEGAQVEGVAVIVGQQALDGQSRPLLRAVWIQSGM